MLYVFQISVHSLNVCCCMAVLCGCSDGVPCVVPLSYVLQCLS